MPIRYISAFQAEGGSPAITFPTARYEWQSQQDLLTSSVAIVGADYEYDQLGDAPAPKRNGSEHVRFLIVGDPGAIDTTFRGMLDTLHAIGRGQLVSSGGDGTVLLASGRLEAMPEGNVTVENVSVLPVLLNFSRSSDWVVAS